MAFSVENNIFAFVLKSEQVKGVKFIKDNATDDFVNNLNEVCILDIQGDCCVRDPLIHSGNTNWFI